MKKSIKKIAKLIKKSKNILLINHIRMDPDAFWSLGAFYFLLKKLGKNVIATNDENPQDILVSFTKEKKNFFETQVDLSEFNPDLIISFDASSLDQLWKKYEENKNIFNNSEFIVIDHHISNNLFWKINIVDTKASSTCEIVFKLIKNLGFLKEIDSEIASLLYTWIITDTNIFYNSNTTEKTLKTASKLIKLWANFRKPIFEFYRKKSLNKTKLWWEVLKEIEQEWSVVYAIVKEDFFKKTETTEEDTSWIINEFLANMEFSKVCFLLYPLKDWKIKASMRSISADYDVSKICKTFSWWWHIQAAWFSYIPEKSKSLDENMQILKNILLEKIREIL